MKKNKEEKEILCIIKGDVLSSESVKVTQQLVSILESMQSWVDGPLPKNAVGGQKQAQATLLLHGHHTLHSSSSMVMDINSPTFPPPHTGVCLFFLIHSVSSV